jgi:hypothetical protein
MLLAQILKKIGVIRFPVKHNEQASKRNAGKKPARGPK